MPRHGLTIKSTWPTLVCVGLIATSALAILPADAAGNSIVLAPHRAVYDMSLGQTRSGSSVTAVKGRMVYELTGSACEGYTQNMRFVTEMATQDSQAVLTDLRSSTWEDGNATLFRFNTTQLRDQKPADATVGDAKRAGPAGPVAVELTKPAKKDLSLKPGTYFPVQHSIALLIAAKAGKPTLRADLYDGSEKGDKAYDTLARIGVAAAPGANKKLPVVKNAEVLDGMAAWPVNISYFEPGTDNQDATPAYELGFLFFDNGVSRKLVIDYGDFAIKGEITDITFLEPTKCEAK
jgi:EipB-like